MPSPYQPTPPVGAETWLCRDQIRERYGLAERTIRRLASRGRMGPGREGSRGSQWYEPSAVERGVAAYRAARAHEAAAVRSTVNAADTVEIAGDDDDAYLAAWKRATEQGVERAVDRAVVDLAKRSGVDRSVAAQAIHGWAIRTPDVVDPISLRSRAFEKAVNAGAVAIMEELVGSILGLSGVEAQDLVRLWVASESYLARVTRAAIARKERRAREEAAAAREVDAYLAIDLDAADAVLRRYLAKQVQEAERDITRIRKAADESARAARAAEEAWQIRRKQRREGLLLKQREYEGLVALARSIGFLSPGGGDSK